MCCPCRDACCECCLCVAFGYCLAKLLSDDDYDEYKESTREDEGCCSKCCRRMWRAVLTVLWWVFGGGLVFALIWSILSILFILYPPFSVKCFKIAQCYLLPFKYKPVTKLCSTSHCSPHVCVAL